MAMKAEDAGNVSDETQYGIRATRDYELEGTHP